jgi:hypothetical protein
VAASMAAATVVHIKALDGLGCSTICHQVHEGRFGVARVRCPGSQAVSWIMAGGQRCSNACLLLLIPCNCRK